MKHTSRHESPASVHPGLSSLAALVMVLAVAPGNLAHSDDRASHPEASALPDWQGSASVDSARGSSLHLRITHEDTAVALSMMHATAGTAGFPDLMDEALDGLSIGLNFDSPLLVAGDLGLAGLGNFIFRPAGSGPLLPVHGSKPLKSERPDGTRYRGFVLGSEGGLLAIQPLSDPDRLVSGAWFSPSGSPVSALLLAGSEPAQVSDDWYKADTAAADRLWSAVSLGLASKGKQHRFSLSGAVAASVGLPGPDGMAGRMEAMVAIQRLRFEAEASLTSQDWHAPDGVAAVPVCLNLSAVYRQRGLELSGAYRLTGKNRADEGLETGLRAHVQLADGKREFRLASTITQVSGQRLPTLTLDTRWRPGVFPAILPGLSLESSWRATDGSSERFDAGASLKGGRRMRWSLETSLRHDTLGRHLKGAASIVVPLGDGALRFGLRSDDWIPLTGKEPDAPLVFSLGWTFSPLWFRQG